MLVRAFPVELLDRPKAERVAYFWRKVIGHPRLNEAHDRLFQAIQEPASAALIAVYGPSGVGKTTLRLRVQRRLTEALRDQLEEDPGRLAVVGVEAIAGESVEFNWRDFYKRTLREMGEPLIDRKVLYPMPGGTQTAGRNVPLAERASAPELRFALEQAFRYRRPRAFFLDEAQHLKRLGSGRRLSDQLDTLKSLASVTGIIHVLFGTYELLTMTELSGQLNRRTIDIHFGRYHADRGDDATAFQSIVSTLQEHLPLAEPPALVEWWEELYEGSVGCVGVLKDWLTRALAMVLEKDAKTLARTDLETQALGKVKLMQMAREIKEGEGHLTDDGTKAMELRHLLGMKFAGGSESIRLSRSTSSDFAAGQRKPPRRRVGERNPVRDPVGVDGNAR